MHETYCLQKELSIGFDEAIARVTELLAEEGFGILTEIDVQATFRAKLGIEFRPYRILGACNATLAQRALEIEPAIAALMPCNVFVQQHPDGRVDLGVMNPRALVEITGNIDLQAVQDEVDQRIQRVFAAIKP